MDDQSVFDKHAELEAIAGDISSIEASLSTSGGDHLSRQGSLSLEDGLIEIKTRLATIRGGSIPELSKSADSSSSDAPLLNERLTSEVDGLSQRIDVAMTAIRLRCPLHIAREGCVNSATTDTPRNDSPLVRTNSKVCLPPTDVDVTDDLLEAESTQDPTITSSQDESEDASADVGLESALRDKLDVTGGGAIVAENHECVYSWGRGDLGALLHPDLESEHALAEELLPEPDRPGFADFATSMYHSVVVSRAGDVRACGSNAEGQVLPGSSEALVARPTLVEALFTHRVVAVSCGLTHSAVVTERGLVVTFGTNEFGQLGHTSTEGPNASATLPRPPKVVAALSAKVAVSIACGDNFTLALTSDAEVFSWGDPVGTGHGKKRPFAGHDGSNDHAPAALAISNSDPKRVLALAGVAVQSIAAGAGHAMALTLSGDAIAWGRNSRGQCGLPAVAAAGAGGGAGPTSDGPASSADVLWRPSPVATPLDAHGRPVRLVQAALGECHSLLLSADGVVFGCGRALQIGLGCGNGSSVTNGSGGSSNVSPLTVVYAPSPAQPSAVAEVAAGSAHSLLRLSNGVVLGCGANDCGQILGGNSKSTSSSVSELTTDTQVVESWTPLPGLAGAPGDRRAILLRAGGAQSLALCRGRHPPRPKPVEGGGLTRTSSVVAGALTSTTTNSTSSSGTMGTSTPLSPEPPLLLRSFSMALPAGGAHRVTSAAGGSGHRAELDALLAAADPAAAGAVEAVGRALGSASLLAGLALQPSPSTSSSLSHPPPPPSELVAGSSSSSSSSSGGSLPDTAAWSVGLDATGVEHMYKAILRLPGDTGRQAASRLAHCFAAIAADLAACLTDAADAAALATKTAAPGTPASTSSTSSGTSGSGSSASDRDPPGFMSADVLRAALALWMCPLAAATTSSSQSLSPVRPAFLKMVRSLAALRGLERRQLLRAIIADVAPQPALFVARLAAPLLAALSPLLASVGASPFTLQGPDAHYAAAAALCKLPGGPAPTVAVRQAVADLEATCKVLSLLDAVNGWFTSKRGAPLVSASQLNSTAVSDLPVVIPTGVPNQLYKGILLWDLEWHSASQQQQQQGGNRANSSSRAAGFFGRFPFLLRADTKHQLLLVEAQMAMTRAAQGAMMGSIFGMAPPSAQYFVLHVQRNNLLHTALNGLASAAPNDLRKELKVVFEGEEGVDAGGVRKEFFQLLIQQLFSEQYGMFSRIDTGKLGEAHWFSRDCSWADVEFGMVGVLVGLALYNGVTLDVHFPPVVYKKLLPSPRLNLHDVAALDPQLAKGLQQLLDFEPADQVEDVFCRTFEVEWESFGAVTRAELVPGGAQKAVNGQNRGAYVEAYVRWYLETSVASQFNAFSKGFARVLDGAAATALSLMSPGDLEAIVAGVPHLDLSALREVASYEGGYDKDHPTVAMFWEVVLDSFKMDEQRKLLMFVTGSMKAPIGGLGKLNFKIQRSGPDSAHLPTSHTCFNTLLLPEYADKAKLEKLLRVAIGECEGFGLQ